MADRAMQHRRLHNLLLIQKLLSLRTSSSPFTLLLDSAEQSARPLVCHYVQNAKVIDCLIFKPRASDIAQISKIVVVFVSFQTLTAPPGTDLVIKGRRKSAAALQNEITVSCSKFKSLASPFGTLQCTA